MSGDATARERAGRTRLPSQPRSFGRRPNNAQSNHHHEVASSNGVRKRKREAVEDVEENHQASCSLDSKTMIEQRTAEIKQKRQRARVEEQSNEEDGPKEDEESSAEELGSSYGGAKEDEESEIEEPQLELYEHREPSEDEETTENGRHSPSAVELDSESESVSASSQGMSTQEKRWWAMNFEELYKYARSKDFGKTGKESRKSGRVKIIKWLCEKAGIAPYVAPFVSSVPATPIIARPALRPTGAVSHPEAILRTSDPALQLLIDKKTVEYRKLSADSLLKTAMERSYQLLKDSNGKLPSKSVTAMSQWLAAWDVLKSPREKKWWLGDGIDLVNKAKAMGYQGPSRKYEVIVWLRSTPKDAEDEIAKVAEPTPNNKYQTALKVSKRHAKGSKRT